MYISNQHPDEEITTREPMKTFELLAADFEERYGFVPRNWRTIVFSALRMREFAAVFLYRLNVGLVNKRRYVPGLRVLLYHILRASFGMDIHPKARIGPGLVVHHAHMIVIGDGVKIGKRFHIYHGVTIGSRNQFDLDTYPSLGDNITIYTGSVVAGKIQIGNDVVIGANSLVLSDVPSGSVVFSNAASFKARSG
jgi:serine O-acetyltransferase